MWVCFGTGGPAVSLREMSRTVIGDTQPKKPAPAPKQSSNILNGTTWPDLRTIAKLETALNASLWGNEHRKDRSYDAPCVRPHWDILAVRGAAGR